MRKKIISVVAGLAIALGGLTAASAPAQANHRHPHTPQLANHTLRGIQAAKGNPDPNIFRTLSCPCYDYAGAKQTVASDGFGITLMTVASPTLAAGDFHTLAELAVTDNLGNTVEWGWTKDTAVCGAVAVPCLFAFSWKNGVPQGYNTGFSPGVGCTPCAGGSISSAIGTTKQFGIQYIPNANPALSAWWMTYNGTYQGAYLASRWTAPTFIRGAFNQVFGEVAANTTTSCTDMGTGVLATGSPTFLGSKFNSYGLVNGSAAAALTAFASAPTKWASFQATGISNRWGGPGWC